MYRNIARRASIKLLNEFISQHSSSKFANDAILERNRLAFEKARTSNNLEEYNSFLSNYPLAQQVDSVLLYKAKLLPADSIEINR